MALRDAVVEDERSLPSVRKQFQEVTRAKEELITTALRQSRLSLNTARRLQASLEPMGELYAKNKPFLDNLILELAAAEEQAALSQGFQPVTLGKRVLRAETAALVALATLLV